MLTVCLRQSHCGITLTVIILCLSSELWLHTFGVFLSSILCVGILRMSQRWPLVRRMQLRSETFLKLFAPDRGTLTKTWWGNNFYFPIRAMALQAMSFDIGHVGDHLLYCPT